VPVFGKLNEEADIQMTIFLEKHDHTQARPWGGAGCAAALGPTSGGPLRQVSLEIFLCLFTSKQQDCRKPKHVAPAPQRVVQEGRGPSA
jgi:hypothetical protein